MNIVSAAVAGARLGGTRERIPLDGEWDFRLEDRGGWRKAHVPGPWQAEFADLREACGVGHYARNFTLPREWNGCEVALRFGAASYLAEVSVNGRFLGRHEGGYLPFEFTVPADVLADRNYLEVRVTLPDGDERSYPGIAFAGTPHGKQSWYGPIGGLWQSVFLEARDPHHIKACRIRPDLASGRVVVEADLSLDADAVLSAAVTGPDGVAVAQAEASIAGGMARLEALVPERQAWSPDDPALYRLTLTLAKGGRTLDTVTESFGFRAFEARDGAFFLNGEPFYLRGALDQDYYPEGIFTPPSVAFLEDQIAKAKALGLNMLRCHIKVPDPRYLEAADRLGMLVWCEIPNVETFSHAAARRMRETLEGILARDGNHPCIVAWTIINEDWGTRLRESAGHREWLVETFDWLKAADPTRLVVDNSPCAPNYHVKTDINDFHYYRSVPERRGEWDQLTSEFAAGADWTFSPHGDAQRKGNEPLVVSEFGVWGLPFPDDLRGPDGADPWWFTGGDMWSDGAASPQGIEQRFSMLRMEKVFGSFDAFIEAAQWYQFENLKYEIETMRAYPAIAGYVVTELTDVHWEANGLMDLERNPRLFAPRFAEINADTVIVPGCERWSFWAGEDLVLHPRIAAGGRAVSEGSILEWQLGGKSGRIDTGAVAKLAVASCGEWHVPLPARPSAEIMELHLRLHGPDGAVLAVNRVRFAVHPPMGERAISVASDDAQLAERLAGLGYARADEAQADVFLTRRLDAARIEAIEGGQKVLLLAEKGSGHLRHDPPPREQPHQPIVDDVPGIPSQPYFSFPGYAITNRDNTVWRGDWVTNFSWVKRSGPFKALPGGPLLDLAFDRVVPRAVISGFRPWEFDGRVHGAVVVGWIQKPVATIIEKAHGCGNLVATTFRLCEDAPGADPTATVLLDCLLQVANGPSR